MLWAVIYPETGTEIYLSGMVPEPQRWKIKDKNTDPTPIYKTYMDTIHHNQDVVDMSSKNLKQQNYQTDYKLCKFKIIKDIKNIWNHEKIT